MKLVWRSQDASARLPSRTALALLRTAVDRAPDRADLRLHLVRALFNSHDLSEVITRTRRDLETASADPGLLCYLGRAALALEDLPLALRALRLAADRGSVGAAGHLTEALHALGRPDEALAVGLAQLDRAPEDYKAFTVVARLLLKRGQRSRLWDLCADLGARGAWRAYIPSGMACAATTPDQIRQAADLLDCSVWLSQRMLDVPAAFNRDLSHELLAHRSLGALPPTRATAGTGNRIEQLERDAGPVARDLLGMLRSAVETYARERRQHTGHPMIAHAPAAAGLQAWAVVLRNDGHETWHVHPDGWISGVYYVEIPDLPDAPDRDRPPGAIEFGAFPFGPTGGRLARRVVRPQAGMLLLFPSYLGHRTWPTGVDARRICVAFDVLPVARDTP